MKNLLFTLAFMFVASLASAQNPIVVGPNSTLAWDINTPTLAVAQGYQYNLTVDALAPVVLTGVTCVAPPSGTLNTCSILLDPQVPMGTHTLTMTAQSGTVLSAKSLPFSYTTLLIGIPLNIRARP